MCFFTFGPADSKCATYYLILPDTTAGSFTHSRPQNIFLAATFLPQTQFPVSQFNRLTILFVLIMMLITFAFDNNFGLTDNPVEFGKE
jgi:hypothetical protein